MSITVGALLEMPHLQLRLHSGQQGLDREVTWTHTSDLPDPWLAPLWLGLAQRYALQRSLAQGLSPDNPYPDGTVNRVVQGVTIHH